MKKRFLALCAVSVLFAASLVGCSSNNSQSSNAAAPQQSNAENEQQQEAEPSSQLPEKVVIGIDDTFAPLGFRDEKGELVGFDIELAKAVFGDLNIEAEFQPIDWAMKETELNNENIDVIWNGYTITDARKEQVLFTRPYLKNRQVVVTLSESGIKTLADLEGKNVAAQDKSSAVEAIESKPDVAETFGELVTFETNNDCLMNLDAGRTDAVVADEILIRYYISKAEEGKYYILEEDFGDEDYGIGVRKSDEALCEAINKGLDDVKSNGVGTEVSQKWFGEDILQ